MNDILEAIQSQVSTLEDEFLETLTASGDSKLIRDYLDIITLRESVKVLYRRGFDTNTTLMVSGDSEASSASETLIKQNPSPSNFIMTRAVKEIVESFDKNEKFSINEVWERLREKYSNEIQDDSRKRSASATLSNLTKAGKLERVKKGEGGEPTIYILNSGMLFD